MGGISSPNRRGGSCGGHAIFSCRLSQYGGKQHGQQVIDDNNKKNIQQAETTLTRSGQPIGQSSDRRRCGTLDTGVGLSLLSDHCQDYVYCQTTVRLRDSVRPGSRRAQEPGICENTLRKSVFTHLYKFFGFLCMFLMPARCEHVVTPL